MQEQSRELKILHFALCFGALSIIILLHFFIKEINLSSTSNKLSMLDMGALVIAAGSLLLANFLFNKKTNAIASVTVSKENINEWRAAYIIKWAVLEAAILINIQIYAFIGNNSILGIIALLLLLLLYLSKPKID